MCNNLSKNENKEKHPKSVNSTQSEIKDVLGFCSSSQQTFLFSVLQLPYMLLSALV